MIARLSARRSPQRKRSRATSQSARPTSEVVCQNSMPCVPLTSANRAKPITQGAVRMLEHTGRVVQSAATANTAVKVQAIAPTLWALAWSSQRCTATRAPRPRTKHAVTTPATTTSDALPVLATAARKISVMPITSVIATMCKGIIFRNALDRYATVCSGSANLPVNGWIGGSAGGRTGSGPSPASRSSLRARSRASSAARGAGVSLRATRIAIRIIVMTKRMSAGI